MFDASSIGYDASYDSQTTATAAEPSHRAVLAVNFDAECVDWWDAWWGMAIGTRAQLPPEIRYLDRADFSAPMGPERLNRMLVWCESQPGWITTKGRALYVVPCVVCKTCEGVGHCDALDFAYSPGQSVSRYFKCEDCRGKGWTVTIEGEVRS